jgi:hypothetical protein
LLAVGFLALAFMLFAELGVLQFVRGISLSQYIGEREPVSGLVYLGMLVLLALLPWLRRKAGGRF